MVESRVSRVVASVVTGEGTVGGVSRMDVLLGGLRLAGPSQVNASRVVAEVVGSPPAQGAISRMDVLVGSVRNQNAGGRLEASRLSAEVVGAPLLAAAASRLDVLTGGLRAAPTTSALRASRLVVEVVARQGSAGPIVPLPLSDDLSIFVHNWASTVTLASSYLTDVSTSAATGAESRRGLVLKPQRTLSMEWMLCGDETADLGRLERLETMLRRMGNTRFQVPLYMDQFELPTARTALDTTIPFDNTRGRFFPGARIAILQFGPEYRYVSSYSTHIIESLTGTEITANAALGVAIPAGSIVMPLIDCEVMLEAEWKMETSRNPRLRLSVAEVQGNNTLPPLKSDNPVSTDTFDNAPIWTFEPDWTRGLRKGRSRPGVSSRDSRGLFVSPNAERARQTHREAFNGKRDEMWRVIEFFDTRRGRLRSFWHIDQDQLYTPVEVDATGNFIGVREIGTLADFSEEFGHVGILLEDGRYFVRKVANIQQVFTVFRLTLTTPLPLDFTAAQVVRIARARRTRFLKDEMKEVWSTDGYMATEFRFLETVNERDATI